MRSSSIKTPHLCAKALPSVIMTWWLFYVPLPIHSCSKALYPVQCDDGPLQQLLYVQLSIHSWPTPSTQCDDDLVVAAHACANVNPPLLQFPLPSPVWWPGYSSSFTYNVNQQLLQVPLPSVMLTLLRQLMYVSLWIHSGSLCLCLSELPCPIQRFKKCCNS